MSAMRDCSIHAVNIETPENQWASVLVLPHIPMRQFSRDRESGEERENNLRVSHVI